MKVGDKVKVSDSGERYPNYYSFAVAFGATNWFSGKWLEEGTITALGHHLDKPKTLALVTANDGRQSVISTEGLAVISPDLTKIDKPFGDLDRSTQVALFESWLDGEDIECNYILGSKDNPQWRSGCTYKVKKDNTEEITKIRKEMEKLTERLEELEV